VIEDFVVAEQTKIISIPPTEAGIHPVEQASNKPFVLDNLTNKTTAKKLLT
jgi:hypothetical protein